MLKMEELDYLRELNKKYPRYVAKYFGFSLQEIAQKIGMSPQHFYLVLSGKKSLPKKREELFAKVFQQMNIYARTKDFKESSDQIWNRSLRERIRTPQ